MTPDSVSCVKILSYLTKTTLFILLVIVFIFGVEYFGITGDLSLWMRQQLRKTGGANQRNYNRTHDHKSPTPPLKVNDEKAASGVKILSYLTKTTLFVLLVIVFIFGVEYFGITGDLSLWMRQQLRKTGDGNQKNYNRTHDHKSPTPPLKVNDEKAVSAVPISTENISQAFNLSCDTADCSTDRRDKALLEPLTFHCNQGRMGNQMCTFAVLQGVGALNKRNISILPCNKKKLDPYFEITIPEVNMSTFVEHNPYDIQYYLRPEDGKISNETNYITGYRHPCSFTFFDHIRHKIRKTFRFRDKFRLNAEQTLLNIKGNRTNVTFVGAHVRRGDYTWWTEGSWLREFEGREVDREYFEKATKYFRDKYPNVIFVVVSDDLEWCRKNLMDFGMYIPEKSLGPGYDMAILTQCNHTLLTYGTFGFWGAYLAGGDVVYFDKFLKPGSDFLKEKFRYEKMYLPEWVGIDTTKPGFWKTYVPPTAPA